MQYAPRNILFVISCFSVSNTGNGGHYHSLKTLADTLKASGDTVHIISVGDFEPPALSGVKVDYSHIDVSEFGFGGKIPARVPEQLTHVHAFDRRAMYFAKRIAKHAKAKLFITKPGGPNKSYHPFAEDIFVFSQENKSWLEADRRLKGSRIHFVPQRVLPVLADQARVDQLLDLYPFDGSTILRIARIGRYYERSIRQTIELAKALRALGISARAVILGTPEDKEVVESLREVISAPDVICTDDRFTKNAVRLLPIADLVVGTGRGLMEAAIAGKPVLCPSANGSLPVPVTSENVDALQATNFSERYLTSEQDPDAVEFAANLLNTPALYSRAKQDILDISTAKFDISSAIETYHMAYDRDQAGSLRLIDEVVLTGGALYAALKARGRGDGSRSGQ